MLGLFPTLGLAPALLDPPSTRCPVTPSDIDDRLVAIRGPSPFRGEEDSRFGKRVDLPPPGAEGEPSLSLESSTGMAFGEVPGWGEFRDGREEERVT